MPPDGKYALGLRGFPTPNDVPPDGGYVVFRVPRDNSWAGLILGAAAALGYSYNFYQWGDLTPDEAAEAFRAIVTQAPYEGCGCVQPGGRRVLRLNGQGHIEQLTDGLWTEPTDDYTVPPVPPRAEPTCDERRCLAAANAANVLQQLYEEVADAVADGADEAEALAVMVATAIIIIGGWLGLALAALVGAILGLFVSFVEIAEFIGADLWDTQFTEKLRCILYECSSCDGDVVTFDFQCVRAGMANQTDLLDPQIITNIRLFGQVDFILNVIGVDGLNAAGATTAIETADCTDCDEPQCRMYDFRLDPYQFEIVDGVGVWTEGVGFETELYVPGDGNAYRYVTIRADDFVTSLLKVEMGFVYEKGLVTGGGGNTAIGLFDATFTQTFFNYTLDAVPPVPDSPLCWEDDAGGEGVTTLFAQLITGILVDSSSDPGGVGTLVYIKVWFTGEPPALGEACTDPLEPCP